MGSKVEREPDFDRFRQAVLLEGEPDWVPLAEIHVDLAIKRAFLDRDEIDEASEVQFWTRAGYDYVPLPVGLRRLFDDETGHSVAGQVFATARKTVHYDDAALGLSTSREWATGQGVITTLEEFESFPWPAYSDLDHQIVHRYMQYAPEGMKMIPIIGHILAMTWQLMGFDHFCLSLKEGSELVGRLLRKLAEYQRVTVEALVVEQDVGGFWVGDDVAYSEALLVSPRFLREHLFPIYGEIGEICRTHDKIYIYHSDGKLYEVLEDIMRCGFNALHPVEPKAMDIVSLKDDVGKRLCLIGNIDLGYTLTRGTPAEVEGEVRERIRLLAPGGGYCLGSSNSITDYVPLENYRALLDTHRRYGRYPISA